ncbi:MAG: sulfotransferase [Actinomycetota bacterium]
MSAQPVYRDEAGRAPEGAGDGPVFIGGLDRSGKTTMRALLASHPRIAIPSVGSNMETYFYRRYGDLRLSANFERCLDAMLRYKHVRSLQPDAERIRREFAEGDPTYERLFALFLSHFAQREGKPRWGAQTGLIERYADVLMAAYPGVRIVHMIRDPRDRYEASLALWPDGKGRAGGAVARWRYSTALAERNLRRYPGQYLIVRFEDLVREPETTVRAVCAFLQEPFDAAMLAMPAAQKHQDLLRRGVDDRAGEGVALFSERFIGGHRGVLAPAELAFMQLHAGRKMRRFGYEPEPVHLGTRGRALFAVYEWPRQAVRMAGWRIVEELQQRFPRAVARRPGRRMIVDPPEGSA